MESSFGKGLHLGSWKSNKERKIQEKICEIFPLFSFFCFTVKELGEDPQGVGGLKIPNMQSIHLTPQQRELLHLVLRITIAGHKHHVRGLLNL